MGEDIDVIEIKTGKKLWRLKGDTEIITTFAVTPDGHTLVSASRSLQLKTWDLRTGTLTRTLKVKATKLEGGFSFTVFSCA